MLLLFSSTFFFFVFLLSYLLLVLIARLLNLLLAFIFSFLVLRRLSSFLSHLLLVLIVRLRDPLLAFVLLFFLILFVVVLVRVLVLLVRRWRCGYLPGFGWIHCGGVGAGAGGRRCSLGCSPCAWCATSGKWCPRTRHRSIA